MCNPKPGFKIVGVKQLVNDTTRPNFVNNGAMLKGAAPFTPSIKSQRNCLAAFFKRSAMCHPITHSLRLEFEAFIHNDFIPNYLRPQSGKWRMLTDDEAIDRMPFTEKMKKRLKLLLRDRNFDNTELSKSLCKLIAFIKLEFYTEKKYPRFIMPRSVYYRVLFSKLADAINHCIYGWDCTIKKIPFSERGQHLRNKFGDGPCSEIDCTAFEGSTDAWLMNHIQRPIYHEFAQGNDDGLIDRFIDVKSGQQYYSTAGLELEGPATLTSGDADTGHWNLIINFTIMCFASVRATGFYPVASIEGDDGVFKPIPYVESIYRGIGFTAKLKHHDSLEDASFCRVYCGGVANLTDPVYALAKLGWSDSKYIGADPRKKLGLVLAKAMSYLVQYSGCPVIGPICDAIITKLKDYNPIAPEDWWEHNKYLQWKPELRNRVPVAQDRKEIERLFNLSVLDQINIEKECLSSIDSWKFDGDDCLTSPTAICYIREYFPDWITFFETNVLYVPTMGKIWRTHFLSDWPSDGNCWTSMTEFYY